jgi:hypothetical protein
MTLAALDRPIGFTPGLSVGDPLAGYWLRQSMLRLRRELAWLWQEQGLSPDVPAASLRVKDKVSGALDMQRFWEQKQAFLRSDPTAAYLTAELGILPRPGTDSAPAVLGSFSWVAEVLDLQPVEVFVLALGLLPLFDNAAAAVIAACLNDSYKTWPTLSLAQRLWDEPDAVLRLADPGHSLVRLGLLQPPAGASEKIDWEKPLSVSTIIARQLLFPETHAALDLSVLENREDGVAGVTETAGLLAGRLETDGQGPGLKILPLLGPLGSASQALAAAVAGQQGRRVLRYTGDPLLLKNPVYLSSLAAFSWLRQADLFLDAHQTALLQGEKPSLELEMLPKASIPAVLFLAVTERRQVSRLPGNLLLPVIEVPRLSYADRLQLWHKHLGSKVLGQEQAVAEVSRRFRFQADTLAAVCRGLRQHPGALTENILLAACRAETGLDAGELAQEIIPRFQNEELILPAKQAQQYQEIVQAMRSLTEVHYVWGTEKVWNESGISVLFAGPPGTGKTMGAEILALRLGLPIYRIDLSQVVSKYIGETEKNLKRLFDLADISDTILFFDEADALFGRRSEVKDAHDRYANLEISYLLERMERFKGLAILATNRKKDLDEAFLRRLRYIVDFPMPEAAERKRIWRQVIPKNIESSQVDLDFLAQRFPLAGGHIRSIVFNACLQSARPGSPQAPGYQGCLNMEKIILAVKREFEKLNRSVGLEQYGPYAEIVEKAEARYARN